MPTGTRAEPGARRIIRRSGRQYWLVKQAGQRLWPYEHRLIGARLLGRALRANEVVHHRNGDGLDNAPGNLEVLPWGQHTRGHHEIATWARHYPACRACGATHRKHLGGGLCSRCYQRQPGKGWKDWRARHASNV